MRILTKQIVLIKSLSSAILGVLICCSCSNGSKPNPSSQVIYKGFSVDSMNEQFVRAIQTNDSDLYEKLSIEYSLHNRNSDLLYYSLLMANRNNTSKAHFDLYLSIIQSSPKRAYQTVSDLDSTTRNFVLEHLFKAKELGYRSAPYEIEELKQKGVIR